jgi:hypothetical protein
MSFLQSLLRLPVANRAPSGYSPGALGAKVRLNLSDLESEVLGATCIRFRSRDPAIEFLAEEQVESQFLMHVVTTRFSCRVAGNSDGDRRISIRHRGSWKRAGIECTVAADARAGAGTGADAAANARSRQLCARFAESPELTAAILPLDFTDCELLPVAGGWEVRIVHFGASEVVYRIPPIRQYVRLSREQLQALVRTFAAFSALLERPATPPPDVP